MSNLIPGDDNTYIFNTENDYYDEYKKSIFALTYKKGGWDCMRHYEILACGCIPYFPDILSCPPKTMYFLPKEMIIEGNKLYEKISKKLNNNLISEELINISPTWMSNIPIEVAIDIYSNQNTNIDRIYEEDLKECYNLINKLLLYLKKNLTCDSISKYILSSTSNTNVKSILYLSGSHNGEHNGPEYLRDLTLRGFKELLGKKCYDIPHATYLYKKDGTGRLHTIRNILEDYEHEIFDNVELSISITNKLFDIIVYGSYYLGMPYYDLISDVYEPSKIILLCGDDYFDHKASFYEKKGHFVFTREF